MIEVELDSSGEIGAVLDRTGLSAGSYSSEVIHLKKDVGLSVQFDYGIVTGTLTLMCSNDNVLFYPAEDVTFNAPAGVAGGQLKDLGNLRAAYYRFDWEHAAGAGAVKVTPFAKGKV